MLPTILLCSAGAGSKQSIWKAAKSGDGPGAELSWEFRVWDADLREAGGIQVVCASAL